jgi:hypothetical protein
LEEKFLDQIPKLILYRRYRDEIFILSEAEEKDLRSFLEKINKMHESLIFTIEISNHQPNFLDLTIYKRKNFPKSGVLDTKTYFKPTETFQYIQASSAHPSFCLKGFVKSKILGHKRNCNNVPDFMKTTLIFYKYLRLRGYSKALFLEQLNEALSGKTKSERSKQRNLFFKTKYNPQSMASARWRGGSRETSLFGS